MSKKIAVVIALSKQEKDGVDVSKEGNGRALNMLLSLPIGFAAEWHHPLIALESDTELAYVVREDGSIDGCRVVEM